MLPLLYYLFQGGAGVTGAKSSDSMGVGQGTPWTSRQLIADGSGCHKLRIRSSSVSCSRILWHVAPVPDSQGCWTGNLSVTRHQLYPLSYSRPEMSNLKFKNPLAEMLFHFKVRAVLFDSYIKLIINHPNCILIFFLKTAHFVTQLKKNCFFFFKPPPNFFFQNSI